MEVVQEHPAIKEKIHFFNGYLGWTRMKKSQADIELMIQSRPSFNSETFPP